jgi:hypothetical protein
LSAYDTADGMGVITLIMQFSQLIITVLLKLGKLSVNHQQPRMLIIVGRYICRQK